MHSVVSGKKVITLDRRTLHQSEEMSRTFSHSFYENDHVLRVDITDLVEVGRGRNDKMYELTLDGVPFGVLPLKPVQLPSRRGSGGEPQRQGSFRASATSRSSLGTSAEAFDDFNPRGSASSATSSRPKAVVKAAAPAPASVDLLGGGGGDFLPAPPAQQPLDPFSAPAGSGDQFAAFHTDFSAARGRANVTAHDLVKEFGGLTVAAGPAGGGPAPVTMMPLTINQPQHKPLPPFVYSPGPQAASAAPTSTALISLSKGEDSEPVDVDQAVTSLVNLNNLLDDGSMSTTSPTKLATSVYADNRSLEEMKASRVARPQQPDKPIFIERPVPPRPVLVSPGAGRPPFPQQQQQQPYGMMRMGPMGGGGGGPTGLGPMNGVGGAPMGGMPMMNGGPTGLGPRPPIMMPPPQYYPQQPPPKQFPQPFPPQFQQQQQQQQQQRQQFPPRPRGPPQNDPFFGL